MMLDDGAALAATFNAAVLALLAAAIPLRHTPHAHPPSKRPGSSPRAPSALALTPPPLRAGQWAQRWR